jgi:hypothetical protein
MTMDIDALRASAEAGVRAAFAESETPPAPPMVRADRDDAYYRSLEAPFLALMADPTPGGLIEHAHLAKHLTPSAERWFWRAHLLAALEAPWHLHDDYATRSLAHSTTYWLRPNPCAVVAGRTDYDDAQNLRERFNDAQRVAVARYLGLVLGAPMFAGTPHAYQASQAIAWCWTDDEATTLAAEALRAEARSYRRPPADDPLNEALICRVERAFADTPEPGPPLMDGSSEEPAEYAIEFRDARWQTLAPWFLNLHSTAFSFMAPAAFRYFLPAAMCHALGPGSEVDPTFHLVRCLLEPSSYRDKARARVLTFSTAERAAVADFLRADPDYGQQSPCPYTAAVVDFWDPDTGL